MEQPKEPYLWLITAVLIFSGLKSLSRRWWYEDWQLQANSPNPHSSTESLWLGSREPPQPLKLLGILWDNMAAKALHHTLKDPLLQFSPPSHMRQLCVCVCLCVCVFTVCVLIHLADHTKYISTQSISVFSLSVLYRSLSVPTYRRLLCVTVGCVILCVCMCDLFVSSSSFLWASQVLSTGSV